DGRVRRVGGGEVEGPDPVERGAEGVDARVGGGEGVIVGQVRVVLVTGEMYPPGVAGDDVPVGVHGRDGEVVGVPPLGGRGVAGDGEGADGCGVDRDRLGADDRSGLRVRGRQRLGAGRKEHGRERVRPVVAGGEGRVGGQDRLAVAAAEVDRAAVGRGGVGGGGLGGGGGEAGGRGGGLPRG